MEQMMKVFLREIAPMIATVREIDPSRTILCRMDAAGTH